eukprot:Platyproteum_vivax@DN15032_c0_g1_i1.p1
MMFGGTCSSDKVLVEGEQNASTGIGDNLSSKRVTSSIPRDSTQAYWRYPSPKQFYKSLERKNNVSSSEVELMEPTVHVHNHVNEVAWKKVLEWEFLHKNECERVFLKSFQGLSTHPSPLSKFRKAFQGAKLFDRHDWVVDRCGKDVRYVIDFYDDDTMQDDIQIRIECRPALDTLTNAKDRITRFFQQFLQRN